MLPGLDPQPVARAFTLVEILIVVVILGILAAVVVPGMAGAAQDAAIASTVNERNKLERAIELYMVANEGAIPGVTAGDGTWGPIVSRSYLKEAPINAYVGGASARVIAIGNAADAGFQTTHAWIFSDTTGEVFAGSFDANHTPYPRP